MFLPILNEIKLIIPIVPNEIDIFKDFTQEWVMHASRKVILIALIAFNLSIIIPFVKSFVGHYRRKAKAAKQITQARMTELLKGEELEL